MSTATPSDYTLKKRANAEVAKRVDELTRTFEIAVGGRESLIRALQHAPDTDEIQLLLGALADPRNDSSSLAAICRDVGWNYGKMWRVFKEADLERAQIQSMAIVNARMHGVVQDVITRSMPFQSECPECHGISLGTTAGGKVRVCKTCGNRGTVTVDPDLKRQEMVLRMGGLLKDGTGVNVHVQQQANTFVAADAMGKFQRASDRILYGERDKTLPTTTEDPCPE